MWSIGQMVRWCKRRYCVVVNDAVTAPLVETEPLVEMAGVDDMDRFRG